MRRCLGLAAALSMFVGCSGRHEPADTDPPAWQADVGRLGTVIHLSGRDPSFTDALTFLETYRDAFSIESPRDELVETSTTRDALGYRRVRLRQVVHGVPVYGGEL